MSAEETNESPESNTSQDNPYEPGTTAWALQEMILRKDEIKLVKKPREKPPFGTKDPAVEVAEMTNYDW